MRRRAKPLVPCGFEPSLSLSGLLSGLLLALLTVAPSVAEAGPNEDDLIQRRAIRGAPLDGAKESEELRQLREFDEASFPRPIAGASSGLDAAADDRAPADTTRLDARPFGEIGPEAIPETLRSPVQHKGEATAPAAIPWLSALKLPDLPVRLDPRVVRYLEFYKADAKGRAIMASWLRRQGRYRAMMESVLDLARLPKGLLYVSMIESSYDPHDKSHAGAIGLWQFLPENGRIYGLRIDHWVDERKDPEKATQAVMRYFADLKTRFGAWPLALAAFNAGYGAVLRSMHKYNTNDYWELCRYENGLPWETTLYVPKLMAAAIVGENRALFGYDEIVPDAALQWERVFVDTSMSLGAVASAAGVPEAQIAALNPQLRRGRTPPGEPHFEVHLPRGSASRFLANYDKSKEAVRPYVVRFGERLDEIARDYQLSTKALKALNGIQDTSELRPGLTIVVPAGRAPLPAPVADTIVVAVPDKDAVVSNRKRVFYRTLPTDTVPDLARFFGVKAADLQRWNNLDTEAHLVGNLVLQIWVSPEFDQSKAALVDSAIVRVVTVGSDEFFELEETKRGRVRLSYAVKAGDDLKKIGKKFGLTVADLERINRFGERHAPLLVGQKLTVYRAMTAAEKRAAVTRLVPGGTTPAASEEDAEEPAEASDEAAPRGPDKGAGKEAAPEAEAPDERPRALPRPPAP